MFQIVLVLISFFGGIRLSPQEVAIHGKHRTVVAYPQAPERQGGSVVTYPGNGR